MPMNDSELEDQLRALQPATPSADLAARIERDFAASPPVRQTAGVIARPARPSLLGQWLRDLGWAGAGAATALGAVAFFAASEKSAMPASSGVVASALPPAIAEEQPYEPAESSRELVAVNDSDELFETADGPVREVRYTYR